MFVNFVSDSIGEYVAVFLGLLVLKALGWFGLGSVPLAWLFGIALAPVIVSLLWVGLLAAFVGAFGIVVGFRGAARRRAAR